MLDIFIEIFTDTVIDCFKMLPFLFLAYLLIEYLEHKQSDKLQRILSTQNKYGYLTGSVLGIIPQCGISALSANLYSSRVITLGTVVAVFLATSDEALPILLSHIETANLILPLILIKMIIALCAGFLIDKVFAKIFIKTNSGYSGNIKDCSCHNHQEQDGILKATLKHTFSILGIIFIVSFVLSSLIHFIGSAVLSQWLSSLGIFQVFAVAIVGFIPNCAASVLLTELFVAGQISFGALISGLCTGAGVGLIVLFEQNKNLKENLKIMGIMYMFAVTAGLILHILIK